MKVIKNQKNYLLLLTLILLTTTITTTLNYSHAASVLYVNANSGNDGNTGETPLTAKKTIQNATDEVDDHGTIHVADGTTPST